MVYGADAMLPVEIDTPTWRRDAFSEEGTVLLLNHLTHFLCRETNFTSERIDLNVSPIYVILFL
jgi:hypothetical protein